MIAGPRFRRFSGEQSVHITVTHDQPGDPRTRLFHKSRAEMHVVPEVIHAQLKITQGELGRVTAQLRRQALLAVRLSLKIGMRGIAVSPMATAAAL